MKTLKLFVFGLLFVTSTQAQVSVNLNIGKPPVWAPVNATPAKFYYLPEIDSYYDVPAGQFIYVKNGKWIKAKRLPSNYNGYNLRNGRVIYITDYRGNAPYAYHKKHKMKYKGKRYNNGKVVYVKHKNYKKKHKKHNHHDDDDHDND
ncbi:hypothetical protein FLAN108750_10815 [Flavobacterium antarcticum]|uniref:hypothetical protein n=1 Tax=Flavobacterium antarcticum TaxID=271155 RepID=UPI0003B75469|nr:hypothetical protein [Flavobacterium antarcticum]